MSAGYRPFDGDAWLGRELPLAGGPYRVLPETAFDVAEEMAFARQGRKARVFKLRGPDGAPYALKTFYRGFSLSEYVAITLALLAFGDIPGLRACRRRLVSQEEAESIGEPGLTYAVLMPWIEGVSWAGVVEQRFPLDLETGVALANQTAAVLARMEARQIVHADISSSNVLITDSAAGPAVELIDVEDMYHRTFGPLPYVPDGSLGYAHPRNRGHGCRNPFGDRFAGAILLTEMLVWSDPTVRKSAADISVFEQVELGHRGSLYELVAELLPTRSPELATLFERAWHSSGLADCPPLAEWAAAMPTVAPASLDHPQGTDAEGDAAAGCPGCGRTVRLRSAALDHAPNCPLRPASAPAPVPDKSTFPGVPAYDGIAFIPLFDGDQP